MVRRKHKANRKVVPLSESSSSSSSVESRSPFEVVDQLFEVMTKKKKLPVVNHTRLKDLGPGYSQYHFVKRDPSIP